MRKVLGPAFFYRSTLTVAPERLGKYLIRRRNGLESAYRIVETEAYHGATDLACDARAGRTARNAPMWGKPGVAYVYFTYGMHWMLNLVTGPKDFPSAVLIRGVEDDTNSVRVTLNGPAKLTKYLKIDKKLNAKSLTKKSGLWVEDRGVEVKKSEIQRSPRIGIDYAGAYAHKPWRFMLAKKKSGN